MNKIKTAISERSESQRGGDAILKAFRFLEDVGNQINALRDTLKLQIQAWGECNNDRLGIRSFKEAGTYDSSEWLWRSVLDTFEIFRSGKGRRKPIIYAAFQISLAPSRPQADEKFFPHVAVLLAGLRPDSEWEQWVPDEFELDEEFLAHIEGDDPWEKCTERRWVSKSGLPAVAFVVPLVDLRNALDSADLVINPCIKEIEEIEKLLRKLDSPTVNG